MKYLKFFILLIGGLMGYLTLGATPPSSTDPAPPANGSELKPVPNPNRPRIPAKKGLQIYYGEGFLTVSFPENTNFMEVIVADEEESVICADVVYPESPTMILPPSTGASLSVTCTTDLGAVYSGWIEY